MLEINRAEGGTGPSSAHSDDDKVRGEPFGAIEIDPPGALGAVKRRTADAWMVPEWCGEPEPARLGVKPPVTGWRGFVVDRPAVSATRLRSGRARPPVRAGTMAPIGASPK